MDVLESHVDASSAEFCENRKYHERWTRILSPTVTCDTRHPSGRGMGACRYKGFDP